MVELMEVKLRDRIELNELLHGQTNVSYISSGISKKDHPVFSDTEFKNILARMKKSYTTRRDATMFSNCKKVYVSTHCEERWNSRVGPASDLTMITHLFEYVLNYEPERIIIESNNFAYIDNHICFYYELKNDELYISTFYGRANLRPGISDIVKTINFNSKNDDQIYLNLTSEELAAQVFPELPTTILKYQVDDKDRQLLFFANVESSKVGHVLISELDDRTLAREITKTFSLNNIKQKHLSYEILFLLNQLGFVNCVKRNLQYTHDLIAELQHVYKKPAIRTFKNWLSKARVRTKR